MKSSFTPSPYQSAVFHFIQNGTGSGLVRAVAGSGKTTTIVKALELISSDKKVVFLAFNKKIATELQSRVPSYVKASTFHAMGFSAWRRFCDNVGAPDTNKMRDLLARNFSPQEAQRFGSAALRLVSVAKSAGVGVLLPDEVKTWSDLMDHFEIQVGENGATNDGASRSVAIGIAQRLLSLSVDAAMLPTSQIDFDDMLYMPLLKDAPFFRQDWLFVDEAQDTNSVQLALLKKMLKKDGRLIAVGDERQAIYGFRGADADAMRNIKSAFACVDLPLTISYRCARVIVERAKLIVPHLEASPTAPEGEIVEESRAIAEIPFARNEAVICRNTAPIVELAYHLIGRGIGCTVLGREIGTALATLVEKMKAGDVDSLTEKLDSYATREIAKLIAKGQEQKAEGIRDKVDCVNAIIANLTEDNRTIRAILSAISSMFSDSGEGLLTLCTAHKSKGLEWNRVYIYRQELMPSKWARQDWQREQEKNLEYVAYTRAKVSLVFIHDVLSKSSRASSVPVVVPPPVPVSTPAPVVNVHAARNARMQYFMDLWKESIPASSDFWAPCDNR